MEHQVRSAGVDRTHPLSTAERGTPHNPGVRPWAPEDLLVTLDLDSPTATMVSEVGSKFDDDDLFEANLLGREYIQPRVKTHHAASVGPGIPHVGALWSDSPSPVVLFRGSRSAPVRSDLPQHSSVGPGEYADLVGQYASPHIANDGPLVEGRPLARDAQFQALIANTARQLHTLGYDWDDVHEYHRAPTTQKPCKPAEQDVYGLADDRLSVGAGARLADFEPNCRPQTAMQPLEIQRVVQPSLMAGDRQCHLRQTSSENSGEMKRLACLNEAATQPPLALAGPVVAAGPAYQTKKNIMKPQTFDGNDSVHSFLAHFEVCANFNSWTEEGKVSWLQWCLKGRAQQLLWDLSAGQLTNYDDLSSKLKQRFGSKKPV